MAIWFLALAAAVAASCPVLAAEAVRSLVANGSNQVEYVVEGRGPLVVMLPSAARGAHDYDEVAVLIAAQGFRVARPEPRGSGRTTGPHEGISLRDVAGDVAAVIRHEGIGPAVVVGHAAGSFVARALAVEEPALVRGVVLAAAGARRYPPELGDIVRKVNLPGLSDEERALYLRKAFFAPGNDVTSWLTGWRPLMRFGGAGGVPDLADRERWWGAGAKPVLEIQGLDDPFKPAATWAEYKAEFGDRVTVVQIPKASHAMFPEQPLAVADAIVKWARSLPPGEPPLKGPVKGER